MQRKSDAPLADALLHRWPFSTAAQGLSEQIKVNRPVHPLTVQQCRESVIRLDLQDVFTVPRRIVILRSGLRPEGKLTADPDPDGVVKRQVGGQDPVSGSGISPRIGCRICRQARLAPSCVRRSGSICCSSH